MVPPVFGSFNQYFIAKYSKLGKNILKSSNSLTNPCLHEIPNSISCFLDAEKTIPLLSPNSYRLTQQEQVGHSARCRVQSANDKHNKKNVKEYKKEVLNRLMKVYVLPYLK